MAVEFKLPGLGENVKSADVVNVLVKPGDVIKKDQAVIEAETDKAVMEVPSSRAGKVVEVRVKKGDKVTPGQVVLTLDETAAPETAPVTAAKAVPSKPAPPPPAAASTPPQPPPPNPQPLAAPAPAPSPLPPPPSPSTEAIAAAPSVRQFAREIGVSIHEVPGTGDGGRISIDDVKNYARARAAGTPGGLTGGPTGPRIFREPLSKIRRVTAETMARAWSTVAHVTLHNKADVTDLEAVRAQYKKRAEQLGARLTITPIFVKIAAAALKVFPNANASLDLEKGEVERHNYVNIGVAVDTPRGLVVPVIRDADRKSIVQIARELADLSVKARDAKLTPDDMSGATFTLTNLGSLGIGFFTPIVAPPQVAILGMGLATTEPHWDGKQFVPRLLAPLSLSFDHRMIDGADGARLLRWIVDAAQNPILMAMEA